MLLLRAHTEKELSKYQLTDFNPCSSLASPSREEERLRRKGRGSWNNSQESKERRDERETPCPKKTQTFKEQGERAREPRERSSIESSQTCTCSIDCTCTICCCSINLSPDNLCSLLSTKGLGLTNRNSELSNQEEAKRSNLGSSLQHEQLSNQRCLLMKYTATSKRAGNKLIQPRVSPWTLELLNATCTFKVLSLCSCVSTRTG